MSGGELKDARTELGLSQAQLALVLGVHVNTVACWERGDKPIGNATMVGLALQQIKDRRSGKI